MTDHTEMQIPDDVARAAKKAWRDAWNGPIGHESDIIASAILAERERCAMIAQGYDHGFYAAEAILGRKLE